MAKKPEIPETLTFAQGRDMLADDLHAVADLFLDAERRCRDGDVGAMTDTIEKMSGWQQMLMLRFNDRMARVDAGRATKAKAVNG